MNSKMSHEFLFVVHCRERQNSPGLCDKQTGKNIDELSLLQFSVTLWVSKRPTENSLLSVNTSYVIGHRCWRIQLQSNLSLRSSLLMIQKCQVKSFFEQRNDLPPEPPDLLGALKSYRELLVLILQLILTTALATSRIWHQLNHRISSFSYFEFSGCFQYFSSLGANPMSHLNGVVKCNQDPRIRN